MDVRDAYCIEDFEWEMCRKIARQEMKNSNVNLMRQYANAAFAKKAEGSNVVKKEEDSTEARRSQQAAAELSRICKAIIELFVPDKDCLLCYVKFASQVMYSVCKVAVQAMYFGCKHCIACCTLSLSGQADGVIDIALDVQLACAQILDIKGMGSAFAHNDVASQFLLQHNL